MLSLSLSLCLYLTQCFVSGLIVLLYILFFFYSPSSDAHMLALLSLKSTLSGGDMRSIRQSAAENRLQADSAKPSPQFFCMVKVKWINNKINQIGLKKGMALVGQ